MCEPAQCRRLGKNRLHRRQGFRNEHVEIAGLPEQLRQIAPARRKRLAETGGQQRPPQAQRRAQTADRHPRLMHEFRIVADTRTGLVALQLPDAIECHRNEGRLRPHPGYDGRAPCPCRLLRHLLEEPEAPLRLAGDLRAQRQIGLQRPRHVEQRRRRPLQQLQFDLADRVLAHASIRFAAHRAAIERHLDADTRRRLQQPGRTQEIGGKHRLQRGRQFLELRAQPPVVDVRKIEGAGQAGRLPLAALRQPAGSRLGALDGKQLPPGGLPVAQGNAASLEIERRRVVVGVGKALALRLDAGQQRMPAQPGDGPRRNGKLEFCFDSHVPSLSHHTRGLDDVGAA